MESKRESLNMKTKEINITSYGLSKGDVILTSILKLPYVFDDKVDNYVCVCHPLGSPQFSLTMAYENFRSKEGILVKPLTKVVKKLEV